MSSPTDDLARVREALNWLTDEARLPALAAVDRLGEQLAEQADAASWFREASLKEARADVAPELEAAEARVSQLEDVLREFSEVHAAMTDKNPALNFDDLGGAISRYARAKEAVLAAAKGQP